MILSWYRRLVEARAAAARQRPRREGRPRRGYFRPAVEGLEGRALPSFSAPTFFGTDWLPVAVAVGDLNGDGAPDLVTANLGNVFSGPPTVSVLLGNGDGSFQGPVNYPIHAPNSVVLGDFNGDAPWTW